jgi:hypothetical protein
MVAVPSLIGLLPVTGGAVMSAPMVDKLGEDLGLSRPRRAAANLIFRHQWFLVFPFLNAMILASELSRVPISRLILHQAPITLAALITSYFYLLRGSRKDVTGEHPCAAAASKVKDLRVFLASSSPILAALVLFAGFKLPLPLALLTGLVLAIFFGRFSKPMSLRDIISGVDKRMVLAMVGVMVFKTAIEQTEAISLFVQLVLDHGIPLLLVFALLPLGVSYATGYQTTTVVILFPVLMPVAPAHALVTYTMVAYVSSFVTYLISPLHLCQVLTNEYLEVSLFEVYKEYLPVVVVIYLTMLALVPFYL